MHDQARNVVDGLALSAKWHDAQTNVTNALQLLSPTAGELTSLRREFDGLADAIDGLSDALTAEVAYQMARGNTARTAATLAAIAHGDAPAPELEVARIPRSGTAVTHRVLALWSDAPGGTGSASGASPMARAEPSLNAWAGRLLGDFGNVRCTFERVSDDDDRVLESRAARAPAEDAAFLAGLNRELRARVHKVERLTPQIVCIVVANNGFDRLGVQRTAAAIASQ